MNTTACAEGYATDVVFLHVQGLLACDMSVSVYVSIGVILIVVKALIALEHSRTWFRQHAMIKKRGGKQQRWPLVPMLSWFMFACYVPFFVLTFKNVANEANGVPAALFGLGWFCIGLLCLFYLFKFVSLGYRIVPHRVGGGKRLQSSESSGDDQTRDTSTKFDFAGKFSVTFCFIALAAQTICFLILIPIFPKDQRIYRIGFGFQAWFIVQHCYSINHHFNRVTMAIRASYKASRDIVAADSTKELKLVLRKVWEQQFTLAFVEILCIAFTVVLATGDLPLYWFVPIILMIVESMNFALIAFSDVRGRWKAARIRRPYVASPRRIVGNDRGSTLGNFFKSEPLSSSVPEYTERQSGFFPPRNE